MHWKTFLLLRRGPDIPGSGYCEILRDALSDIETGQWSLVHYPPHRVSVSLCLNLTLTLHSSHSLSPVLSYFLILSFARCLPLPFRLPPPFLLPLPLSTCLHVPARYAGISQSRHNMPVLVCRSEFWFVCRAFSLVRCHFQHSPVVPGTALWR